MGNIHTNLYRLLLTIEDDGTILFIEMGMCNMTAIIKKAETLEDCEKIAEIAYEIWMQHYESIVSEEQVSYMLEKYQSATVIYDAINDDHAYYMAYDDGKLVGYCGIAYEENAVFLSKIYILLSSRGQGIARLFFDVVLKEAQKSHAGYIWLTVNKGNTESVAIYEKMGFYVDREDVDDIGGGFVKDDYIMKYEISST